MDTWSYKGRITCGGHCANPDNDPRGPWCYTKETCAGRTWDYCGTASPGTSFTRRTIEVLVIVDHALAASRGTNATSYAHDIANRLDAIYDQVDVDLAVTKTLVFDVNADPWGGSATSLENCLNQLTEWIHDGNPIDPKTTQPIPFDVVLVLTGLDLDAAVPGLSWVGTACSRQAISVIQAKGSTEFVASSAAHELGHILGASDDGVGNACSSGGFVMTPILSPEQPPTVFSSCSKATVLQTFQTLDATNPPCLYRPSAFECGNGQCAFDYACYGGDAVNCPAKSCQETIGVCDVTSNTCSPGAPRVPSVELMQAERDAQCQAVWAGYAGHWVAGDRSGSHPNANCGTGCGDLRCTNSDWSNYCYTYTCPAGFTCTLDGEQIVGPATREVCSCFDTKDGQAAQEAQQVDECAPCLRTDGTPGFCTHGECLAVTPEDVPSSASQLTLSRSLSRGEKLMFSATPSVTFPPPGSATDPRVAEAAIELFSANGDEAHLDMPPAGWTLNSKQTVYTFINKAAPDGFSAIRGAILKKTSKGTQLKVKAKSSALPLQEPNERVGLRFTVGALRVCALFNEATVKKDEVGQFVAAKASAGDLKECSPSSLRALP